MSKWYGPNDMLHPTPGRQGRSVLRPYKEKNGEKWELVRGLVCRFAGPGADKGHPSDNRV